MSNTNFSGGLFSNYQDNINYMIHLHCNGKECEKSRRMLDATHPSVQDYEMNNIKCNICSKTLLHKEAYNVIINMYKISEKEDSREFDKQCVEYLKSIGYIYTSNSFEDLETKNNREVLSNLTAANILEVDISSSLARNLEFISNKLIFINNETNLEEAEYNLNLKQMNTTRVFYSRYLHKQLYPHSGEAKGIASVGYFLKKVKFIQG